MKRDVQGLSPSCKESRVTRASAGSGREQQAADPCAAGPAGLDGLGEMASPREKYLEMQRRKMQLRK